MGVTPAEVFDLSWGGRRGLYWQVWLTVGKLNLYDWISKTSTNF